LHWVDYFENIEFRILNSIKIMAKKLFLKKFGVVFFGQLFLNFSINVYYSIIYNTKNIIQFEVFLKMKTISWLKNNNN